MPSQSNTVYYLWIHIHVKKGFEGGLLKLIHVTHQTGWVSGDGGSCEIMVLWWQTTMTTKPQRQTGLREWGIVYVFLARVKNVPILSMFTKSFENMHPFDPEVPLQVNPLWMCHQFNWESCSFFLCHTKQLVGFFSPTVDQILTPAPHWKQSLNHWTTRKVRGIFIAAGKCLQQKVKWEKKNKHRPRNYLGFESIEMHLDRKKKGRKQILKIAISG